MGAKVQQANLEQCGQCVCLNLRKATRAITQVYDRAFQPHGLRATQFQILANIANRGPVHINDLAHALVMDRTTLSRDLGPLEKQGWITVQPGEDRRTRAAALTAKGRRLLKATLPAWKRTQEKVVKGLGSDGFGDLLKELSAAVSVARSVP